MTTQPQHREFIVLMAMMAALDAFSIDAILPAMDQIAMQLQIAIDNHRQYVVTALFLGFSLGVLLYGFAADSLGRRTPVLAGFFIYIAGTLICLLASTYDQLLFGRVLQGFGAAGPYVLSVTIVRDLYQGRQMARAMSLIMMVFIGIPMIAPFIGQGLLLFGSWRIIFLAFLAFAVVVMLWFWLRQPETLAVGERRKFGGRTVTTAIVAVLGHQQSLRYMLILALQSGAFIAYLSTAQQVFQEFYGLGVWFPVVFAALASLFGLASYLNSLWVERIGMARLIHRALSILVLVSGLFFMVFWKEPPSLIAYLLYLSVVIPLFGFCFGNTTSLALEPQGEIAGAASSIVNSFSTLLAILLASVIGSTLTTHALPVVAGFGLLSALALVLNKPNVGSRSRRR